MSDGESRLKTALVTYFPMVIAVLSLITSIVGSYVSARFLDFVERNTGRVEYLHTCKDIIDAYFQVKLRADALSRKGADTDSAVSAGDQIEGLNAVAKFAALGTYLANLRDEAIRARYTELSRELRRVVQAVRGMSRADFGKAFEGADVIFAELNADCVKRAKDMRM